MDNMTSIGPIEIQEPTPSTGSGEKRGCCGNFYARRKTKFRKFKKDLSQFGTEVKELVQEARIERHFIQCCDGTAWKNRLPIISWLPKYRWKHFQGDFVAGLTVGLTVLPQGIAYAKVANLPPQYGLYSSFLGVLIYMVFGTSKDITLGPTAIMSLLTAEFGTSRIAGDATYAILLSLFTGIIQVFLAIFRIGFFLDFVSYPVINSFTTAAAFTIIMSQFKKWFTLTFNSSGFIDDVHYTFAYLGKTHLWDFLLGLVCVIALFIMKRLNRIKWGNTSQLSKPKKVLKYCVWLFSTARNATVVVLAAGVAAIFYSKKMTPFTLTGTIKAGLPPWQAPAFSYHHGNVTITQSEIFSDIGVGFLILPLLGILESIAIGNAFAHKNNYEIDGNQEFLALGIANILGSFVGAYPVTGSFSRTAVNAQSGVRTPAAGIWTALVVLLAVQFLTPLFYYIPNAALAAIIIMAVIDLIDFTQLPQLWKLKKIELVPWCVTFVTCLLWTIEYGILLGIAISVLLLLYPLARPKITIVDDDIIMSGYADDGKARNEDVIVLRISEGLRFPGALHVQEKVTKKSFKDGDCKNAVLDFSTIASFDYTSIGVMELLLAYFKKRGKQLIICNMQPEVLEQFKNAKLPYFQHAESIKDAIQMAAAVPGLEEPETPTTPTTPNTVITVTDEQLPDEASDEFYIVGDQQITTFRFQT